MTYELAGMFACGCRWRGLLLMPCRRHTTVELAKRLSIQDSSAESVNAMRDIYHIKTEWTKPPDKDVWRSAIAFFDAGGEGLPEILRYVVVEVPGGVNTEAVSFYVMKP